MKAITTHRIIHHFLLLVIFFVVFSSTSFAGDRPWRAAGSNDLNGIWRQAGVVILNPALDKEKWKSWFYSRQFFWFLEDNQFKHMQIETDSQAEFEGLTQFQKKMMEESPSMQSISWRSPGVALIKHPERPQKRVDIGIYQKDAESVPHGGKIKPKTGDMIIVFYEYKNPNKPSYYRLLRKISDS